MTFPKRLLLLVGGIVGVGGSACGVTFVVKYKPWGVPDHRRAEYEAKLDEWDRRDEIREQLADKPKPDVHVPSSSHDFGLYELGEKLTHTFRLENRGDAPVGLSVADFETDCITAELTDTTVEGGAGTEVLVSFKPVESSHHDCGVTIATTDPLNPEVRLQVGGEIRQEVVMSDRLTFETSDPLERTAGEFVVCSQLWSEFEVVNVECDDLEIFDWHAEPLATGANELSEHQARSGWRVQAWTAGLNYGKYAGKVRVTVKPAGSEPSVEELSFAGRVRSPIIFHSPDIDRRDGLDIGTLNSGKEHSFHLLVRVRGNEERSLDVLDVKPDQLNASLSPLSKDGDYRLTLTVPDDCPMVVFNAYQKHGYVQVGDPNDKEFSSWFPVYGAVVDLKQ